MVNMLQAREIKQAAAAAGFDLCGICRVRNFSAEQTFFEGWLERGFDGGLGYLRRNVEKRFSPAELMPGARSVVVCGVSYKNDTSLGYGDTAVPKVASYARSGDYHVAVKEMLYETAAILRTLPQKRTLLSCQDENSAKQRYWLHSRQDIYGS